MSFVISSIRADYTELSQYCDEHIYFTDQNKYNYLVITY